jgi:hypothetical protein
MSDRASSIEPAPAPDPAYNIGMPVSRDGYSSSVPSVFRLNLSTAERRVKLSDVAILSKKTKGSSAIAITSLVHLGVSQGLGHDT